MKRKLSLSIIILLISMLASAQLPLITDNTGTQGKGKSQIEVSNGVGFRNEHRCIENSTEIASVFSYGVLDNVDLVLGYPFLFSAIQDDTSVSRIAGFSDVSFEVKYRFLQHKYLSLAIKPGILFPTGKYQKGLGSGKFSGSVFLMSTVDIFPLLINGNIGYIRNENKCGDALDIWHVSIDFDYKLNKEFHFVLNPGVEKNPDPSDKTNPVFGLAGIYYCINEDCEISLGYKHEFTKVETNHSFIYGLTVRF